MEKRFASLFEGVSLERSKIFLLRLREPDILKKSIFTDHETDTKKFSFRKITKTQNIKRKPCCIIIRIVVSAQ